MCGFDAAEERFDATVFQDHSALRCVLSRGSDARVSSDHVGLLSLSLPILRRILNFLRLSFYLQYTLFQRDSKEVWGRFSPDSKTILSGACIENFGGDARSKIRGLVCN